MPNFEETEPILSANTRNYLGETAFADDRLDRRVLAEKLTGYLSRLNDGAVLAIDAPWGEGKTWFGRNWAKYLEDEQYKVSYIDAFEQDYIEDPFMLITSEILDIIGDKDTIGEALTKSGAEVAKTLLPVIAKGLLNLGARVTLGSSSFSEEVAEALEAGTDATSELASKWLEESLESYSKDKSAMIEFKTQLAEYAQAQDKPIVVFIDELDRCKPTFAVNLVERIKHFFDVPNIVFVLLLNHEQLEKAVKGVYGVETDASAYLGKFVNFFFALPKAITVGVNSEERLQSFINTTMKKYKFTRDGNIHDGFMNHLKLWAIPLNMSLRDIEKATALYAFSGIYGGVSWIMTYLIALKIKEPKLYNELVTGEKEAHARAKQMIEEFMHNNYELGFLSFYVEWHEAYIHDFKDIGKNFLEQLTHFHRYYHSPETLFPKLAAAIDLSID